MSTRDQNRRGGRARQAARNDELILAAAREVFLADPSAPMSAVAARAGVGMSALYLRYPSRPDMLRDLCREGLRLYVAQAEAALADTSDAWTLFSGFLHGLVETQAHALTVRLAGTFAPSPDLYELSTSAQRLTEAVFARVAKAGVLRQGLDVNDIGLLCEMLSTISLGDAARRRDLRQRYLAILLDGLKEPAPEPLPSAPPSWEELSQRWQAR